MTLYNAYGQANTTIVSGSSLTGLNAPDGSYNIVLNSGLTGLYHPCGAYNAVTAANTGATYQAPSGCVNVVPGVSPSGFVLAGPTGDLNVNNGIRNFTMSGAVVGSPGTLPTNWSIAGLPTGVTSSVASTGTANGFNTVSITLSGTNTSGSTGFPVLAFEASTTIPGVKGQTWSGSLFFSSSGTSQFGWQYFIIESNTGSFLTQHSLFNTLTPATLSYFNGITGLTNSSTTNIQPYIGPSIPNSATVSQTITIGWPIVQRFS